MMTVSEIARHTGVTPEVIRYYTRLGLITPRRGSNGYRFYNNRDIRYLEFISQAKLLGFTLKEIGAILKDAETGNSPCSKVRATLEQHLKETREKVSELLQLQGRMEDALKKWDTIADAVPEGDLICVLIESTGLD